MFTKLKTRGLKASVLMALFSPSIAFAQASGSNSGANDFNDVITNIVVFLGNAGYLILAIMVTFGMYCLYVFGTNLQKMGEENQREEVKVKTLVLSVLGAIVCTYGTYTLGLGMRTVFQEDATSSSFSIPTNSQTSGSGN